MSLVHYIFVRRDLPLGVIAAMVTHAAGESSPFYQDENGHFRHATAVVLEAKDEKHLRTIGEYLRCHELDRVEIIESGGPYANQLMAIGLVPLERTAKITATLGSFQTLKTCLDNAPTVPIEYKDSNDTDSQATPNLGV